LDTPASPRDDQLGYEMFAGNRTDVVTVEEIVEEMEERYGKAKRVWVMDRGMTSEENLDWLREGGRKYLIGTPRSELRKWEQSLLEQKGWQEIRDGLEVKLCPGPDGTETFILCRSADRQVKEKAMHDRFAKRIEAGLQSLARRLERARRAVDRDQVQRQIGRLGNGTRARVANTRSRSWWTTHAPPACGSNGMRTPATANGPSSAKAPTSCVRT